MINFKKIFVVIILLSLYPKFSYCSVTDESQDLATFAAFIVLEGVFLGFSAWSASEYQNDHKISAYLEGSVGLYFLYLESSADADTITLGLGLLAVSHYNIKMAQNDAKENVFKNNFLGLNLIIVAEFANAFFKEYFADQNLSMSVNSNQFTLVYRF